MSKKRNHLVTTAYQLFYQQGFHASGIDTILAQAGVAKMTLYNHFESKNALIEACLAWKSARVFEWIEAYFAEKSVGPREKIPALFDLHEQWYGTKSFRGCVFAKAAAEFPDRNHIVHISAAKHLRLLFEYLAKLGMRAGLQNPHALAEQIVLLLEGATTVAFTTGATIAARRAKRTILHQLNERHS